MGKAGISPDEINRCVDSSFTNHGDPALADNSLLKAEMQK